jgi:hypothetical protein
MAIVDREACDHALVSVILSVELVNSDGEHEQEHNPKDGDTGDIWTKEVKQRFRKYLSLLGIRNQSNLSISKFKIELLFIP